MKVSKFFAVACSALMVSACADEVKDIITPEIPEENGNKEEEVVEMIPITVTVTENSSRVSHTESDNTITVAWEADDVIYLGSPAADASDLLINAEGSGFTTLTVKEGSISENGKTASFTGKIPSDLKGQTLLAFYGKADNLKVKNSQVIMDFTQQTQSAAGLSHLTDYDLMSAVVTNYDGSENINLQFKHEGSIFKVKLTQIPTGESISKVLLSLPEGTNSFVTTKTFSTDGQASNGNMTNNLELNVGSISGTNYEAVFTLCPTTLNSNMSISVPVTNSKGVYSYTDNLNFDNITLESGKYYWTPELVLAQDNSLKGEGTSESPYIIDNVDKFNKIADVTDAYYTITQDMDFTGVTFTPISTFSGTLDGNGKTVSNLTFKAADNKCGLVGNNIGTIRNLNFNNITLNAAIKAGIVAAENNGTIDNCHVNRGSVQGSTNNECIGGFVGHNKATISSSSVQNISVVAEPTSNTSAGGFVGKSETTNCNIIDSYVSNGCTIKLNSGSGSTNRVGGFVGSHWGGNIYGCYSNTTMTINAQGDVGGFAGLIQGPWDNKNVQVCYSLGSITNNLNWKTGGFAGNIFNSIGNIKSCYTLVNVTITNSASNAKSNGFAADKSGSKSPTIEQCYSNKNINNSIGTKVASIDELRGKISDMNKAASDSEFEFITNADDTEPLIIQKKQ